MTEGESFETRTPLQPNGMHPGEVLAMGSATYFDGRHGFITHTWNEKLELVDSRTTGPAATG